MEAQNGSKWNCILGLCVLGLCGCRHHFEGRNGAMLAQTGSEIEGCAEKQNSCLLSSGSLIFEVSGVVIGLNMD